MRSLNAKLRAEQRLTGEVRSGLTFTQVANVLWELQMSTAQGGGEQADGLLEGRVEAGDSIEDRVTQQLRGGRPSEEPHQTQQQHTEGYAQPHSRLEQCFEKKKHVCLFCASVRCEILSHVTTAVCL